MIQNITNNSIEPFLPVVGRVSEQPININLVEKKFNAKFVGDFCLKTKDGGWTETPSAIFWQENPPVEGYSHYFGVFVRQDQLYITDGSSAFSEPIVGVVANDGEVIFSRYRHDYKCSSDGSVFVDGGRDYCRQGGNLSAKVVHLIPDGPNLKIVPTPLTTEENQQC